MKFLRKKLRGLSLIEVMVSMGIFSLMMVTVAGIFSSSVQSARANRNIEHDLENAQFVMNDIAKQLRTSTVVDSSSAAVRFYDYSQGKCVEYRRNSGSNFIERASATTTRELCVPGLNLGIFSSATTGDVVPVFAVIPSVLNTTVGRVTMVFVVKEKSASERSVRVQTTVSLRDYVESGVMSN